MNPLTNIRSRQKQREQEVLNGIPESASYHSDYRNSAYIYAGQLSFNLTEGDLLAIFSQYGEIVDVNLVRDKNTRKSRGFGFLAYEDQRSTDLAVDNLNGITVDGRVIAVDHVKDYKRLVENPEYVDTRAQQPSDTSTTAQASPATQPSERILSGAEAEAIEEQLGTSGIPESTRTAHAGSHSAGQRAPPLGPGGSSIAAMLREVEAYVGDWRSRGTSNAPAPNQKVQRVRDHPRAGNRAVEKIDLDGQTQRRHRHKDKREKSEKKKSKNHSNRTRSRSPRPHMDAEGDSRASRHRRDAQKNRLRGCRRSRIVVDSNWEHA